MNELLKELAEKLGISTSFTYGCGTIKTSVVGDDVLRFFIESLGYGAKNDEEIRKSLERLEKRRWQKAAESVYVMTVDEQGFDLVLSEDEAKGEIEVSYAPEGNGIRRMSGWRRRCRTGWRRDITTLKSKRRAASTKRCWQLRRKSATALIRKAKENCSVLQSSFIR